MKKDRLGEVRENKNGQSMVICSYVNCDNILVKILDTNEIIRTTYNHFKNGSIKSKFYPSVVGVGYLGEYDSVVDDNGNVLNSYWVWSDMLDRCYKNNNDSRKLTYKNCSVCEEWHNYSNFKKWYNDNYYKIEGEVIHLDKDILTKGNKIYSPDTCIFAPNNINILFAKSKRSRGDLPIGVSRNRGSSFSARIHKRYAKHPINIGYFKTIEEAFIAYKREKEQYIKETADQYKDRIPKKLYDAMYKYEVEITD